MSTNQFDFLEERLESTELLTCACCQEETLHVYEEVLSRTEQVVEVLMRCTSCLETRTWIEE